MMIVLLYPKVETHPTGYMNKTQSVDKSMELCILQPANGGAITEGRKKCWALLSARQGGEILTLQLAVL